MNEQLIAAILKLASAQEAQATAQANIAAQLGRIADQITPSENEVQHPGNFANYMAYMLTSHMPDNSDALEQIAAAIASRSED